MTELNIFNTYASKDFDVYFQGEAFLDSEVDICYLRYGEDEISAYVNDVIKPEMIEFFNEKKAEIGSYYLDMEGNLLCLKGTNVQESSVDLSGLSLDDRYMTLNSQQNIAAVKTFLSNPVVSNNVTPAVVLQNTSVLFGSAPDADQVSNVNFTESSGTVMGAVQHKVGTDASVEVGLCCSNLEASESSEIAIGYDEFGEVYTKAPTPASADNSTNIATTAYVKSNLAGKADANLANLTASGQMVLGSHNGTISNCVLNIPQNINVELSNGKFTLKAGSKVYVPNGVGDFEEIVFAQDASVTPSVYSTSTNRLIVYSPLVNTIIVADTTMSYISSGTTTPTSFDGNGRAFWYDTTNNLLKRTGDSGSTWVDGFSFPIALVDITNGTGVTNIRQIFNGAGYIGHHAFIVPNVKALLPDGLNSDGNYKSINYTASTLQTIELSANSVFVAVITTTLSQDIQERYIISETEPENPVNNTVWYNPVTNLMQQRVSGSWVKVNKAYLIKCTYDGTSVTNFEIFQSVKVATIDMLDKVQGQVDTNTSNIANKQDTLVSGTSIKTINSTSLLGSGNISLLTGADIANMQTTTNLVTSVSSSSTDSQYPSAKLFYDTCGDIETLINAL